MSSRERFEAIVRSNGRAGLVTLIDGPAGVDLGAQVVVEPGAVSGGTLGDPDLDAAATAIASELIWSERSASHEHGEVRYFVDVTAPAPRLLVVGAIDLAEQLCRAARLVGWQPFVIDPRSRFATVERFPSAERVIARWPEDAFAELGGIDPATAVIALSHDPKLDQAALAAALMSDACFVGAMGSRRAVADRRERLNEAGLDEDRIAAISSPVGLDLGALTPGETAISIVAEVIAVRAGRDGGRLSRASGRIHA